MSLFNKKTIARQIAFPPPADPARLAAFKQWAASIKSGRVASLKETELHGPSMELMIKALEKGQAVILHPSEKIMDGARVTQR